MDVLPNFIETLDAAGQPYKPPRRLTRVSTGGRLEADWDRILESTVEMLADALRAAEVIGEDSNLKHLGNQIDYIDLVFAEVQQKSEEFRRLVLVEDKLLGNPEAKREVLAQILDYARTAQEVWPRTNLVEKFRGHEGWVTRNEEELRLGCRRGDFLLVITGDGIDDRLERLARRFAGKDDPLTLTELALVSMATYELGNEFLLIPHIVNAVRRSERELTVRVVVEDVSGSRLRADVSRDVREEAEQASRGRLPVREEVVDFLESARKPLDAALRGVWPDLKGTAKPRKSLDYWLTLTDGSVAAFKVHFGGYERDAWSPILVGFSLGTKDTATRDAWQRRIETVIDRLPPGTKVDTGGPRTLNVLKSFEWSNSTELNDALVSRVTDALRQFGEVLIPILKSPSS